MCIIKLKEDNVTGKFDGVLICTDLDGTLLKNDKTISFENIEAITYFNLYNILPIHTKTDTVTVSVFYGRIFYYCSVSFVGNVR